MPRAGIDADLAVEVTARAAFTIVKAGKTTNLGVRSSNLFGRARK
jgi:hypothetical protein